MSDLDQAVKKLDGVIKQKLAQLTKGVSTKKLEEIHLFMREAKGLLDTLISIEASDSTRQQCETTDEIDETFFDFMLQACYLVVDLYTLMDDEKIKETNSEWIFDETQGFIELAKSLFGPRIPALPEIRIVSRSKKKEGVKGKEK
jgi:hypothetical protein